MSRAVFERIKNILDENKVQYWIKEHERVHTSEQAAKARGFSIEEGTRRGAKAMILKADDRFIQCVVPGNKTVDMKKVRTLLNAKSLRLATPEEVLEVIDCEVGSIPPFASLFNIPVYADKDLADEIDLNPGLHEVSITMSRNDWEKVVKPTIADIGKERAVS